METLIHDLAFFFGLTSPNAWPYLLWSGSLGDVAKLTIIAAILHTGWAHRRLHRRLHEERQRTRYEPPRAPAMPVRALDSGWPAQTPQGAVADCLALGASVLMLYDADWSAPSANKTTAYIDAVDQGGIPVIPICTPSNTPPATAQQVLAIMIAQDLSHKFCMFDLETYSFPSVFWMAACVDQLHGAGWKVVGYGFQSTKTTYWSCGFDYWLGVIAYAEAYGYIPPWADGLQYTDKLIGPSGATYDGSTLSDALWAAFIADPPTPPEQEENLVKFIYGSPQAQFVSNGLTYVWIPNAQGITVYTSIFKVTDLGPVNGLVGMGVPADPATAKASGQPWPPKGPAQP